MLKTLNSDFLDWEDTLSPYTLCVQHGFQNEINLKNSIQYFEMN